MAFSNSRDDLHVFVFLLRGVETEDVVVVMGDPGEYDPLV